MKKILLLIALLGGVTFQANAKYNFDLSKIAAWGGDSGSGVTYNNGTKTLTFATTDKGAGLWQPTDLLSYNKIYVKTTSNCAFNLQLQFGNGDDIFVDVAEGTASTEINLPITYRESFNGFNFKVYDPTTGSIVFDEIYAEEIDGAKAKNLAISSLGEGWPSADNVVKGDAVTANTISGNTITMGKYSNPSNWCGVNWWLASAWDSDHNIGVGTDYSAYNRVVIRFSEATTTAGQLKVYYNVSNVQETEYVDIPVGTTEIQKELHATYKYALIQVTIEAPQSSVFKIADAYFTNDKFVRFNEKATQTRTATTGAYVELTRTLKAGWNTICLPFATNVSTIANDAELYEFTGASNTSITLTKKDDGAMVANTPYFVKTTAAISDPIVFTNVTVSNAGAGSTSEYNGLTFKGNYTAGFNMENKYGIANGVIRPGSSTATLKAFGAYFDGTWPVSARELNIVIDDETTGISTITSSQFTTEDVYNLNGQRIQQPQKGIYIKNGKKYIAK